MKSISMRILFTALLTVFAWQIQATEDQITFANKQQEALYKELIKELRCPKCQNQNIADSNAVVAKDMRVKTKQLVDQGQDKNQVIDYMVNRYGQFAHYRPPINPATIMLWLMPIAFVLAAGLFLVRRSKSTPAINASTDARAQSDLDKELASLMAEEGKDK